MVKPVDLALGFEVAALVMYAAVYMRSPDNALDGLRNTYTLLFDSRSGVFYLMASAFLIAGLIEVSDP